MILILPRLYLIALLVCSVLASSVRVVRRTPSMCDMNSCVRGTISESRRSAVCNSQRQNLSQSDAFSPRNSDANL